MPVSKATIEQIARSMKAAEAKGKPFAVLLGAGASRSAGIPTASEMADELARQFYERDNGAGPPDDPKELWEWAEQSDWYTDKERDWKEEFSDIDDSLCRYAGCMAELEPEPRQEYLLECCSRATGPNWAHLFVAQLIDEGYVDIILTTNFDDLMRRALLLFGGRLPAICEHPQTASHVEIEMPCPQIVYLHGSAVYYDTCHTPERVQKLRGKFGDVVSNVVKNKGLLVVGYRGAELDVMATLDEELSLRPPRYRLYWVAHERSEEDLTPATCELLALQPGDHLAMLGQDADDFFARLCGRDGLGLDVPNFVQDPFAHGVTTLEGIPEMPEAATGATSGLVAQARARLQEASSRVATDLPRRRFFDALAAQRKGTKEELEEACRKYEQAVAIKPDYHEALNNWGTALDDIGQLVVADDPEAARGYYEKACKKYEQAVDIKPDSANALNNWGCALVDLGLLVAAEDPEAARGYYEQAAAKCEQAVDIKPDKHDALNNWGIALAGLARLVAADNPKTARGYYEEACEKYEQAVDIKSDKHQALSNWGNALGDIGELVSAENPEAARGYYKQACGKCEQAVHIKSDFLGALGNWCWSLLGMAHIEAGDKRQEVLQRAEEVVRKAEEIEPGSGLYNLACVYAMQGREEEAFAKLREALKQGKQPWAHVAKDRDWDDLRDHEEYQKLDAEFGGE